MIKGYQQKITELYEKIQEDEKKALRRRKEETYGSRSYGTR